MEYSINDDGVLSVFDEHGRIVAEISECEGMPERELEKLAQEVYNERGV